MNAHASARVASPCLALSFPALPSPALPFPALLSPASPFVVRARAERPALRPRLGVHLPLALLLGLGCATPLELAVDLRTDLEPGFAFVTLQTELASRPGESETWELPDAVELFGGARVAEYRDLPMGAEQLTLRLLGPDGAEVAVREVGFDLDRSRAVALEILRPRVAAGFRETCVLARGRRTCWGSEARLRAGASGPGALPPTVLEEPPQRDLCLGSTIETCSLAFDGTLRCVSPQTDAASVEAAGSHEGFARLACGGFLIGHRCLLSEDGAVECNGFDNSGQLGDGEGETPALPIDDRVSAGLFLIRSLAAGTGHSCALGRDRRISCWGANGSGQIGDGTLDSRFAPIDVGLSDARTLEVGYRTSCVVGDDGGLACWGFNPAGAIAAGSTDPVLTPTPDARGDGAVEVAVGNSHLCVRDEAGGVACWGGNGSGQAGGGADPQLEARAVDLPGPAVSLDAGFDHSCAVVEVEVDGEPGAGFEVYCWGDNEFGQLGFVGEDSASPVRVELPALYADPE